MTGQRSRSGAGLDCVSRSEALIFGLERAEVSRLLLIEEGCARDIRRRLHAGVDLSVPAGVSVDPDPLFVRATNWLLCESGCDWLPNLAAETRGPNDSAARVALAKLARGDQDMAVWDAMVEPIARAYYEEIGYEASRAGALVAVCDLYFGRIVAGVVHPVVGVHCIAFFSWMTTDLADHWVVQACARIVDRWLTSRQRSDVDDEIRSMAAAWQSTHESHVPIVSRA